MATALLQKGLVLQAMDCYNSALAVNPGLVRGRADREVSVPMRERKRRSCFYKIATMPLPWAAGVPLESSLSGGAGWVAPAVAHSGGHLA